ncbi:MAG: diaminopimelate dehydrogenase [Bacteroidales bacterium]|nr:diaminopimelate dehydrogenase [Bacteroidales bacterium]
MKKIKIGIAGYGNLGRGVELAAAQNPDIELVAIFTRREPGHTTTGSTLVHISELKNYTGKIDVLILCGGSATDLPVQGPELSRLFNTVDSFDTHARIPEYFRQVDESSRAAGKLSLVSAGWDPGLFSLIRLLGQCVLPSGHDCTFWGRGVSQGHSDAIRRIPGVKNAIQYTVPVESALERVRSGENPELTTSEKHIRECHVVAEEGADLAAIEKAIITMPNYFSDYNTTVNFITEEELKAKHSGMPHGGVVIRTGTTGNGTGQRLEFSLNLESNPEFTASVIVAYARAIARMASEGQTGARTVFDIPFALLSPQSSEELRKRLL